MSSSPCNFYISSFNINIVLQTTALITQSNIPPYNETPADAVATFPIGLSVLNQIFQYSSNVYNDLKSPALPSFHGDYGVVGLNLYGGNIQSAMDNNLINAYIMNTVTSATESGGVVGGNLYLNPSIAMLPTSYSTYNIPVALNGTVLSGNSSIASINNSGGNVSYPKGPQIVHYPSDPFDTVPATQMLLKYDFLRYLSRCLVNTPYGVSIFINQVDVFDDIDNQCIADLQNIDAVLTPTSSWTEDNNHHFYYNNVSNTGYNVIANMYARHPERFTPSNQIADTPYCVVPFMAGDTIRHVITMNSAPGQAMQTDNVPILPRQYEIIWDIIDDTASPGEVKYGIVGPVFLPSTANSTIAF